MIAKRDTIMKLFCSFFPSYSDFFFQHQSTLSMNDFLYDGHDNCFALVADRWHLKNLTADRNCFNFRAFSEKRLIDRHLSCMRVLTDAHTTCFDSFFSNGKLLRKQCQLEVVR